MSIKSKFGGSNEWERMAEVEREAKEKLRSAGLYRVRLTVVNVGGEPTLQIDGDDKDELATAATLLQIEH
jgi:5-keto 4-deoxyuronate isomerase